MPALTERATLAATLQDPTVTLARAAATYILFKRKRLTAASERGYRAVLDEFTSRHSGALLRDFEPPAGTLLIEDFLAQRWGELAERTYNKSHSILSDFFQWHVARGTLDRDPVATIERAKARPIYRQTFTDEQCQRIFAANPDPRDQIALRLLLNYAIRKGALRGVQLEHFNREKRELVVFTKGEKYHVVQVVEEAIWDLLEQLDEPDHHYLLPRQQTRARRPPYAKQLAEAAQLIARLDSLADGLADDACVREVAALVAAVADVDRVHALLVLAASTQTRRWRDEQMGEHGAHLWWYAKLARAGIVPLGTTAGRRMHSARHTAIQRVLDKTGNLKAAQKIAGHATTSTTGDIYTDWTPEQTRDTLREVLGATEARS